MTTTTSKQNPNDTHQPITQQHQNMITQQRQNTTTTDTTQDQNSTTQNEQRVPSTPGHRDPMVRAASPGGPATEINNCRVVDLAATLGGAPAVGPVPSC